MQLIQSPILAAAFGQRRAGDDAFGGWVADSLLELQIPRLQVLDLTWRGPTGLLENLEGKAGLIVIDAVQWEGAAPGEIVDQEWTSRLGTVLAKEKACSSHGLSVAHQLALAAALSLLPDRVRLIGAVIRSFASGDPPTPAVADAVPEAVRRIAAIMEQWTF